jgi:hypothetical protein
VSDPGGEDKTAAHGEDERRGTGRLTLPIDGCANQTRQTVAHNIRYLESLDNNPALDEWKKK